MQMKPEWYWLKATQCFLRQRWLNVWSSQSTLRTRCCPASFQQHFLLLNRFCWLNIQGHCNNRKVNSPVRVAQSQTRETSFHYSELHNPHVSHLLIVNSLAVIISSGRIFPTTSLTTPVQIVQDWKTPTTLTSHQILLYLSIHRNIRWQEADQIYSVKLNILIFLSKLHFPFKWFHLISMLRAKNLNNSCPEFSHELATMQGELILKPSEANVNTLQKIQTYMKLSSFCLCSCYSTPFSRKPLAFLLINNRNICLLAALEEKNKTVIEHLFFCISHDQVSSFLLERTHIFPDLLFITDIPVYFSCSPLWPRLDLILTGF